MASLKGTVLIFGLFAVVLCKTLPVTITATDNKADPIVKEKYRLTNYLKPILYEVDLTVGDLQTETEFSGVVKISLKVGDNPNNLKHVMLNVHKYVPDKTKVKLYDEADKDKKDLVVGEPVQEITYETYTLTTASALTDKTKTYILEIHYKAPLHTDMYGFYRSYYFNEEGKKEWLATTQFQPTHARRAFPCFDEPNLKAEFIIKITHPETYHALGNTGGTRKPGTAAKTIITEFVKTPKMSSYLIAFIVSKFSTMTKNVDALTNSVWSQDELVDTAKYGLDIAPKILTVMADKIGVPYTKSGLSKLDQVAIPDFSAGAMENWGLVTYRESALLWDKAESSNRNKQRIAAVVAHELAHMWFGNLITCDWWEVTWLNEGFARFFEYYAAGQVEIDWELDQQFVVEQHQAVFNSDASKTSQALTSEAFSPAEVSSKFGTITYSKGGSVLRMMQHFLTTDVFFAGLKKYFTDDAAKTHMFGNTKPEDLWAAMQEVVTTNLKLPKTVAAIMENWTKKNGFPVVSVEMEGKKLKLSQKQFFFDPELTSDTVWTIPISFSASTDENKFSSTAPKLWLENPTKEFPTALDKEDSAWVVLNVHDTAFYRVNYDEKLWKALEEALKKEDFDGIAVLNRAKLIDDSMNLARAAIITYSTALDVTNYIEKEDNYYPWYAAFNAFSYLRRRVNPAAELGGLINQYISKLMTKLYEGVSFAGGSRKQVDIHKKVLALTWACQLGDEACIENSKAAYQAFRNDNVPVDPDLRSVVYCTALRNSDDKDDWDFLWNRFNETKVAHEATTIMSALGCTKNVLLLIQYLEESIKKDSIIRSQDAQSAFTSVISGNPEGVPVGLKFFDQNFDKISTSYGGMGALTSIVNSLADRLTTEEQITEFAAVVNNHKDELGEDVVNGAIQNANENLKWVEKNEEELTTYIKAQMNSSTSVAASSVIIIASIMFSLINKW